MDQCFEQNSSKKSALLRHDLFNKATTKIFFRQCVSSLYNVKHVQHMHQNFESIESADVRRRVKSWDRFTFMIKIYGVRLVRSPFFLILLIHKLSHSYSFPLDSSHQKKSHNSVCRLILISLADFTWTIRRSFEGVKTLNSNKFALLCVTAEYWKWWKKWEDSNTGT